MRDIWGDMNAKAGIAFALAIIALALVYVAFFKPTTFAGEGYRFALKVPAGWHQLSQPGDSDFLSQCQEDRQQCELARFQFSTHEYDLYEIFNPAMTFDEALATLPSGAYFYLHVEYNPQEEGVEYTTSYDYNDPWRLRIDGRKAIETIDSPNDQCPNCHYTRNFTVFPSPSSNIFYEIETTVFSNPEDPLTPHEQQRYQRQLEDILRSIRLGA